MDAEAGDARREARPVQAEAEAAATRPGAEERPGPWAGAQARPGSRRRKEPAAHADAGSDTSDFGGSSRRGGRLKTRPRGCPVPPRRKSQQPTSYLVKLLKFAVSPSGTISFKKDTVNEKRCSICFSAKSMHM